MFESTYYRGRENKKYSKSMLCSCIENKTYFTSLVSRVLFHAITVELHVLNSSLSITLRLFGGDGIFGKRFFVVTDN